MLTSRKGVPRVVWRRPRKFGEEEKYDSIPFLSVSRSLGDFWSFNPRTNSFTVSPKPDVCVHPLNPKEQRFIVIASDGLWNVMSPDEVVRFIWDYEHNQENFHQSRDVVRAIINEALRRWEKKRLPADNIAVLIAFLTEASGEPPLSSLSHSAKATSPEEDAIVAEEVSRSSETESTLESTLKTSPPSPSLLSPVTKIGSGETALDVPASPSLLSTMNKIDSNGTALECNLQRNPLKRNSLFSRSSPIGKRDRVEDIEEGIPSLKRSKQTVDAVENGISEVLVDDDSGVCSDDNMSSQPASICG